MWLSGGLALAAAVSPRTQEPARESKSSLGATEVERAFVEHGIRLDLARGLCAIPVTVDVREDLLEYLLVNPRGAAHESLFVTEVVPSRLNAALLAMGAVPGTNAVWRPVEPPPTPEEIADGKRPYTVEIPTGQGLYLYAAWRESAETYFLRVEDLVRNLESGRSMRRHAWIFLGSRMVRLRGAREEDQKEKEVFAADFEGNLVNIAFFEQGNTLLTAALVECVQQTIWLANGWLLPARGSSVELIFSRQPLAVLPEGFEQHLPVVPEAGDAVDGERGR